MTSYLIRALHEWCTDNSLTPQLAVKVDDQTQVPLAHVKNGEIILNISYDATRHLKISNELINFSARFSGVSHEVCIPVRSVYGIFAKETGQGMTFDHQKQSKKNVTETLEKKATKSTRGEAVKKSRLQLVK
tara:strand:- start:78 stop:473 length:396 start_codon:yes stop_codon:yes gene_type:complete